MITILTPAYNRAHTLERLYESLERQTYKNFCWLVVDDGSNDNTRGLISELKGKSTFQIKYLFKNNGGKHTAINDGVKEINTLLTFTVDSDDYLTEDALETIYTLWGKYGKNKSLGGIWFLNKTKEGKVIGDPFKRDEFIGDYVSDIINAKVQGDKATVYLTSALREFPSPIFDGEKRVATGLVHKKIGTKYKILFVNKAIYVCEYQQDGLTNAGAAWRIKNPLGGMENSKEFLTRDVRFSIRVKKMLLYGTYAFLAKKKLKETILKSGNPILSLVCTPFSFIIYSYWKKKY